MFKVPERFRILSGALGSTHEQGNNGAFRIPLHQNGDEAFIIASDGMGWEHVSVQIANYFQKAKGKRYMFTPSWDYMAKVKDIFWQPEDCVMQLHPPKSRYVNNHPNILHLWRPIGRSIPQPPTVLVGLTDDNNTTEPNNMLTDLRNALLSDSDLYLGYQANIAVSFQDAYAIYRKEMKKRTLSYEDIHTISNTGAKHFLDLLISQSR